MLSATKSTDTTTSVKEASGGGFTDSVRRQGVLHFEGGLFDDRFMQPSQVDENLEDEFYAAVLTVEARISCGQQPNKKLLHTLLS